MKLKRINCVSGIRFESTVTPQRKVRLCLFLIAVKCDRKLALKKQNLCPANGTDCLTHKAMRMLRGRRVEAFRPVVRSPFVMRNRDNLDGVANATKDNVVGKSLKPKLLSSIGESWPNVRSA